MQSFNYTSTTGDIVIASISTSKVIVLILGPLGCDYCAGVITKESPHNKYYIHLLAILDLTYKGAQHKCCIKLKIN